MPIRRSTRYFFSSVALLAATSGIFYSGLPARARGQAATNSAWTIFAPANDVSFTISTPRPKYGVHNQISLNYRIANIGNRPLYVPKTWQPTCLTALHVQAWFENSEGRYFVGGYGMSCPIGSTTVYPTLVERMNNEAVLIKPGEHFDGSLPLDPAMFHLTPGGYLIEATMYGWKSDQLSDAQQAELAKLGSPFLSGEIPATLHIQLVP